MLSGAATLPMKLRGVTFALSAPSFFQTNTDQAEKLVAAVEDACGFSGDGTEVVLDLFCGVGTLGLCVGQKGQARLWMGGCSRGGQRCGKKRGGKRDNERHVPARRSRQAQSVVSPASAVKGAEIFPSRILSSRTRLAPEWTSRS